MGDASDNSSKLPLAMNNAYTSHRTRHSTSVKNIDKAPFTLDMPKAMLTKLRSCTRDVPFRLVSTLGVLRIFCQAGFFEIFKSTLLKCAETDTLGTISVTDRIDDSGNRYAHTLFVSFDTGKYTINIYNAGSTLLINGPSTHHFIDKHLPIITRIIAESFPSKQALAQVNHKLEELIEIWFTTLNNPFAPTPNDKTTCHICSTPNNPKSLACDSCKCTFHRKCVGVKAGQAKSMTCYTCLPCKDLPAITNTVMKQHTSPTLLAPSPASSDIPSPLKKQNEPLPNTLSPALLPNTHQLMSTPRPSYSSDV